MVCEFLNIFSLGFLLLLWVTIELILTSSKVVIKRPIVVVCNGVNCCLIAASFFVSFIFLFIHYCFFVYIHSISSYIFFVAVIHNGIMMVFYSLVYA